jgi:hypothetical protein
VLKVPLEKTFTEDRQQTESNKNWARQALIDDVDAFRAKITDWNTSNQANDTTQKLIDEEIEKVGAVINQDLQTRVVVAERRVKWCVDMITVWHKEAEKRKKLQADQEAITAMENVLIVFEQDIPDQQGSKGEFEPRKPVPLNIKGRPPPVPVQA